MGWSAAPAIAWEFRSRHRWGFGALLLYLITLAGVRLLLLAPGQRITLDEDWQFAFGVIVPLGSTFMYLLAVFSFGLTADLAARQSIYPARMFTLPVTSSALAGWPMFYGATAMALLWLATRFLGLWPSEVEVPWIWPALFAAVGLAWTQGLTWMPYRVRGLRVVLTILWLALLSFVVLLLLSLRAPEPLLLALLAPQLPMAYLLARLAVTRARHGDVLHGRLPFSPIATSKERPIHRHRRIGKLLPRWPDRFSSPVSAQVWFEWRRQGRSLPVLVGLLLPFELSLLFAFRDTPSIVFGTLGAVLLTPPFMAAFAAANVSRSSSRGRDSYELTPFIATKPLTSTSLLSAKLLVTMGSALASWLVVLTALPLAVALSDTGSVVAHGAREVVRLAGGEPQAWAMGLLGLLALVLATWKQLVQSLYIGMSGRPWLIKAKIFSTLSILTLLALLAPRLMANSRSMIASGWNSLPWILTALVCLKMLTAAQVALRLHRSRLLSDRSLVIGALGWTLSVLALLGWLVWLLPAILFPSHLLGLVAVLAIPLVRISAAPLALHRNRHR
ncbi:MAG: hypothetical protein K0U98_07230 [Deltaproteobacteria bacterium]|nr:hypothetical protein [Deltaproteobacteria bacterium]